MIVENNDFTDKVVLDLSRTGGLCTLFALKGKKKCWKEYIECIDNNKTFNFYYTVKAVKSFVLVGETDHEGVLNFFQANQCYEKVILVRRLSEVKAQVWTWLFILCTSYSGVYPRY